MVVSLTREALLIGALAATVGACGTPPRPEPPPPSAPPLPAVAGDIVVDGLTDRVTVRRDRWGIPHIRAENQRDLFMAQGFVQAQDRLFQMDLWRRSVQGRLAEVLGANFIERDAMTRRVQFRGDADADWASMGPDAKAIATAFTQGINAWIAVTRDQLPEEFALAGWQPEPWAPEDLLNRTEAFVASAGADDELFRARLASAVGVDRASELLNESRASLPRAQTVDLSAINFLVGEMIKRAGTAPFFTGLNGPVPGRLPDERPPAPPPLALPVPVPSSVSFAIGRSRSSSREPLVAGAWLGALERPALRYLVHLTAPGWNVAGATAPWRPGVAIGHNDHLAWSFAPTRADTQDVFVERLNPANPRQVAVAGGWRELTIETESIRVKGRTEPFDYERQYSPHGVVVALDRERHLAYVLRWSGFEPGAAAELGALALGRARNWPEFRAGLTQWRLPTAEFVYADRQGHIARQTAGLVPRRPVGRGLLPSAGWTREGEWNGWTSLDQQGLVIDPAVGLVATAPASQAWRARIDERLSATALSAGDARDTLRDPLALSATQLVPLLEPLRGSSPVVESARRRLLDWDRMMSAESTTALLYVAWENALARKLAAAKVPSMLLDEFVVRANHSLTAALLAPSATWFDANPAHARDRLLLDALAAAADDEGRWTAGGDSVWGRHHTMAFVHPLAVSARAARRYNVGPFAMSGYAGALLTTVRATATRSLGPVVRLVADLADWDRTRVVVPPGQSAAPDSPHRADLAQPWLEGADVPLVFTESAVASATETTLTLVPR